MLPTPKPTVILIYCDEGGDKSLEVIQRETFLANLNSGEYGDSPVFANPDDNIDMDCFVGYILIEGKVIQPKPLTVVTKFEL